MSEFPALPGPGASARFFGVASGLVTNNQDPQGQGRVKASLPWLDDQAETDWARVAAPMAGAGRGTYFLPEVGDEVLVAFEHGDPAMPYVLGGLWNGQDQPPESNQDGQNSMRTIRSRGGSMIRFSDVEDDPQLVITDRSGANSIVIRVRDDSVTVAAGASVILQVGATKVALSRDGIQISASSVTIEAQQQMTLRAAAELTIRGSTVSIN